MNIISKAEKYFISLIFLESCISRCHKSQQYTCWMSQNIVMLFLTLSLMQNFERISLDFLSCTRETKRDTSSHLPLPFKWEIQGFHFKPYLRNKETFIRYVAHGTKKSKKVLGVLSKISYIIICTKDANLFSLLCYPYF